MSDYTYWKGDRAVFFTYRDIGCHADGTYSHKHIRERLAALLQKSFPSDETVGYGSDYIAGLIAELHAEPSDDYFEEDEAIEALEERTQAGLYWHMSCGSLFLSADEEWYEDESTGDPLTRSERALLRSRRAGGSFR